MNPGTTTTSKVVACAGPAMSARNTNASAAVRAMPGTVGALARSEVARAALIALAVGLALVLFGPPPGDLPAHLYRTALVEDGVFVWDTFWYAGHYPLFSYSLLYYFPAALLGNDLVALASVVAAAALFASLAWREWGEAARWPARTFAVVACGPLFTGTYPYAAGGCCGRSRPSRLSSSAGAGRRSRSRRSPSASRRSPSSSSASPWSRPRSAGVHVSIGLHSPSGSRSSRSASSRAPSSWSTRRRRSIRSTGSPSCSRCSFWLRSASSSRCGWRSDACSQPSSGCGRWRPCWRSPCRHPSERTSRACGVSSCRSRCSRRSLRPGARAGWRGWPSPAPSRSRSSRISAPPSTVPTAARRKRPSGHPLSSS